MRNVLGVVGCGLVGALTGQVADYLAWNFDFPHLAVGWLARVLAADGEAAYDAHAIELMVDFFVLYLFVWVGFETFRKRRKRRI